MCSYEITVIAERTHHPNASCVARCGSREVVCSVVQEMNPCDTDSDSNPVIARLPVQVPEDAGSEVHLAQRALSALRSETSSETPRRCASCPYGVHLCTERFSGSKV